MKFIKNLALIITALILIVLLFLVLVSPQKTKPFLDKNGSILENSIAEIRDIEINGIKQRILIRGKDLSNPVLLHLHGGPGGPDRPLMNKNNNLEDIFTVCYWDQRGAGASYSSDIPLETMTQSQFINDGIELTKYLLKRFDKEKISVEAHSWGTFFGIQMVHKNPELFSAYFGIGQGANSIESEKLSYEFVYSKAESANDTKTLKKLEEIGKPPYKNLVKSTLVERKLLKIYENPKQKQLTMFKIYKDFVLYREYSINDKLKALKGSSFSLNALWPNVKKSILTKDFVQFKIPIYIFQGKYDMTTVTPVAKDYFDIIEAPKKGYFVLNNSAHWPHINEFEEYKSIIKSIIKNN